MTAASEPSPTFARPPVAELIMAVEFVPRPDLTNLRMLSLYERLWQERFPGLSEHPSMTVGSFEPWSLLTGAGIQVGNGAVPMRLQMAAASQDRIIQLQSDRLVFNWRRLPGVETYPSYELLREEFVRAWAEFCAEFGDTRPVTAETTYLNSIPLTTSATALQPVLDIVIPGEVQGTRDAIQTQLMYSLDEQEDGPGRIVVASAQAGGQPSNLSVSTRLSAVATPPSEIVRRLDQAHDLSVRTFLSLTSDAQRAEWGQGQ